MFEDTAPVVEGLSIDEAFLDVRGLDHISGTPVEIAARLRRRVRDEVGLPITVGVARTKFLAKVASAVAKPDGLLVVAPAASSSSSTRFRSSDYGASGGSPRRSSASAGSRRSARSRCWPSATLVMMLGRASGRHLHALAHNYDPRPVRGPPAPALDRRPARPRTPAPLARGTGRRPDRARRPGRAADARRAAGVPDGGPADALRGLLACDAVLHATRGDRPDALADPDRARAAPRLGARSSSAAG